MRVFLAALLFCTPALARDYGQWKDVDPEIAQWYRQLMQPDTIGTARPISCCGESDSYWADEVHVKGDKVIAIVTDDRDDVPLMRAPVPIGTQYVIPPNKIVRGPNPTGHVVIFLGGITWVDGEAHPERRQVLCYVMGSGT